MSAQHTPGRLEAEGDVILFPPQSGAFRGFNLEGCPNPEANARRLVACWNACEGVPTPDLEVDNVLFTEMLRERATLKAQRDELLAAARTMSAALDDLIAKKPVLAGVMSGSTTMGNQRVEFRAAIKQVEAAL